jgi:hypothetical protein
MDLKSIIDKAVSTTKSAGLGVFDALKKVIPTVAGAAFPIQKKVVDVASNIKDDSTAGIVKNTIAGVPRAAADVGRDIVLEILKVPFSAGEAAGRMIVNKPGGQVPGVNVPGFGNINSYQSDVAKKVEEGGSGKKAVGKAALDVALNEPLGIVFKPLAVAGSLLMKSGAPKLIEESLETIAKSNDIKVITETLSRLKGIPKSVVDDVAPRLVDVTEKKEAQRLIDEALSVANQKERGLITSVRDNPAFDQSIREGSSAFYTPATDAEALANAKYLIDNQIDEAYKLARATGPATKLSNTVSLELVSRLQTEAAALRGVNDAQANKLYQDAIDIVENTATRATTQGQAIQSLSLWSKMTPEGIILHAQKVIDKANDLLPKGKAKIKLTPDKAKKLSEEMDRINKLPDGEDKIVDTAMILKEIQEILPVSLAKKISTVQTIFQLLNPKTFIRNIGGNLGFAAAENVSSVFASTLDAIIPGQRSMAFPSLKIQAKGFKDGLREGYRDAVKGIDTQGAGTQFDIPSIPTFKKGDGTLTDIGAALEKTLNVTLRAPDRAFFKAAYDDSLARQMKASNVTEPTDEMVEVATNDGLYRTFQDENAATYIFKGLKRVLNLGKEFGVGDFVLKYPKTPANLLNRGLAYTPAGFIKTVMELGKPLMGKKTTRKTVLESFSRAFTGTAGLFGIGAGLYNLGLISTGRNKDEDIADLRSNIGLGEYKINASGLKRFILSGMDPEMANLQEGDVMVSYDWFQPAAISVSMGANFAKNRGDKTSLLTQLIEGVSAGSQALSEQALVKGITRLFKSGDPAKAAVDVWESIPSSFVPTVVNQVRQLVDEQKREVYDPNSLTYSLNLAKNRIPFLSEKLPPKLGSFGQEVPLYQTGNNIFNVMFNPAFVTKYKPTPEASMVIDLQKETGETRQFPRVVQKDITINGESRKLTAKERWNMQLYTGTVVREIFEARANSPEFNSLPSEEKVSELASDLGAVGEAAKVIVLGDIPKKNPSKKAMDLIQAFISSN